MDISRDIKGREHDATHLKKHAAGFTLLELLIVITLLSVIAGAAISAYEGVKEQGRYNVSQFEMTEIRKALIQFRKDSGSNDFPGQGIYDCTDAANGNSNNINPDIDAQLPISSGLNDATKIAWCQHPANFWMLFQNPLANGWNIDTKRGWNGPYLQRKDGFLSLSSNAINLDDMAHGLWAISDPYVVNHDSSGVEWSVQANSSVLESAGAPYVLLVDITNASPVYKPRLVSAGQDHVFEANNSDDCITPLNADGVAMDQVLCLLD